MKKTYLIPETEEIRIGLTSMIAASVPNVKVGKEEEPVDAEYVESRRQSFWDDEESED